MSHTILLECTDSITSNIEKSDNDVESEESQYKNLKFENMREDIAANRVKRFEKSRKRTAEDFLNTDERKKIAEVIFKRARAYKIAFDVVEKECAEDLNLPGAIAQVFHASKAISECQECVIELLPAAFVAAENLIHMQEAMQNLTDCGVPGIIPLEISRRVLDADIEGSQEIVFTEEHEDK
jgi:hypothetical protein